MFLQIHFPFYILLVVVTILSVITLLLAGRLIRTKLFKQPLAPSLLGRKILFIPVLSIDIILIGCVLYGCLIEPNFIQVNSFSYTSKKVTSSPAPPPEAGDSLSSRAPFWDSLLSGVPSGRTFRVNPETKWSGGAKRSGVRIVHISDLHIEEESKRELAVPDMVNNLNPHIIVMTGDYLNEGAPVDYLKRFLAKLKCPFGIYAVSGNWDTNSIMSVLKESGVTLLDDRKIILNIHGTQINLYGLSFSSGLNRAKKTLDELGAENEGLNILLCHMPDIFPDIENINMDFVLCGHTHGGQVRIPFYGALVTLSRYGKLFEEGWYKSGNTMMYVNRGIGLEGMAPAPRVRFLCRPEIMLLEVSRIALP